ncbi:MAG: DJ-1/PfpI family protein [Campylobacter sp.]|nr:DJ-1/PfpI family protein [Campylobacter sp.]
MKKILILVGDMVEDYEAMVSLQILQFVGYEVDTVAPGKKAGEYVKTAVHDFEGLQTYTEKLGHNFYCNKDFDMVKVRNYDGLVITGGRAPEHIQMVPRVNEIIKEFNDLNKPIAAVCHGPLCLVSSGVVKDKKVTAYPTLQLEVELGGGIWVDSNSTFDNVVVDKNLVTVPAWGGHGPWMREFVKLLGAKIEA